MGKSAEAAGIRGLIWIFSGPVLPVFAEDLQRYYSWAKCFWIFVLKEKDFSLKGSYKEPAILIDSQSNM